VSPSANSIHQTADDSIELTRRLHPPSVPNSQEMGFAMSIRKIGIADSNQQSFGKQPNHQFNQNLPELALIEGNQQVATKPDESISPSLFIIRSHFGAIHHH
jgi:hypothetical protein